MSDTGNEPAVDAIAQLVPATLKALHALEFAGRHLSPNSLPQLIEAMAGRDDEVNAALSLSRTLDWPERLAPVRDCLEPRRRSGRPRASPACARPPRRRSRSSPPIGRCATTPRPAEAIYPMTAFLKPVSQFFLEAVRARATRR